ncbi:uncharacterized protein A4U43_C04F5980 [Asparagus officinalis]|uniref:Membrane insertase YidC/Oxa/ALB C-terminal domain-containing protein n=1 Tax=Asparagus officinalis TaxID=4686 RepID=A0A5P1EYN3_ASPOF|nr:ALBINO3-like protein 1, chloroplastic [Asparagus officinalis]ONK71206.1 uncharacterized protein A4U43_C04F5980 [Asparagus officinalis]
MTGLLSFNARPPLLSPFPFRSKPSNPLLPSNFSRKRAGFLVARSGYGPHLADLGSAAQEIIERAEGFIYTVADAAVSSAVDPALVTEDSKKSSDWFSGITNYMETVLKVLKDGLSALHVPYAYGFAIILLTVIVKAATFPLTKKQVESAMAMRSLQPQVKAIQKRYAGDQERIQLETARLYKLAGVNPLAGCLPTLATIPVWIGLYRALSNVADEGLLTEGFFWIPSLSGPTTIAARQSGSGTSWLFPFVDGHPPLGWSETLPYLVLPALLVVSQYISAQVMQPPQSNDPNQQSAQAVTKLLPLMIGYFALSVPSGLSLYWFTNNILSTAQQIQKLGGAKNPVRQFTDNIDLDEPLNSQKSISNMQKIVLEDENRKVNSSQEVKSVSGPRPGERFKQIKEQEERRRKQRDEEKRRAEEDENKAAAATVSQIITEQKNPEVKLADNTIEKDPEKVQEKGQLTNTNGGLSSKAGPKINGDGSPYKDTQKEQIMSSSNQDPVHDTLNRQEQAPEEDEA